MAKTVNYAGTVLGLNTEKYTKSLNTLKTQSASCANWASVRASPRIVGVKPQFSIACIISSFEKDNPAAFVKPFTSVFLR